MRGDGNEFDNSCMFELICKNARAHTHDRQAELLAELDNASRDVVCITETRAQTADQELVGGQ
eukprot:9408078-Pyramimonas_sp.AAC.1